MKSNRMSSSKLGGCSLASLCLLSLALFNLSQCVPSSSHFALPPSPSSSLAPLSWSPLTGDPVSVPSPAQQHNHKDPSVAAESNLLIERQQKQRMRRRRRSRQDDPLYQVASTGSSRYIKLSEGEHKKHHHNHQHHHHHHQANNNNNQLRGHFCSSLCSSPAAGKLLLFAPELSKLDGHKPVCGSDGNFYTSMCELKRHNCIKGKRLFARPLVQCTGDSVLGADEHAQVIPLHSFQCDRNLYEQMKVKLLQGSSSLASLFQQLDVNSNWLLEAHELWPRQLAPAHLKEPLSPAPVNTRTKLIYRDSSTSANATASAGATSNSNFRQFEFAFQPAFPPNPCSLSHLILFEQQQQQPEFVGETTTTSKHQQQQQPLTWTAFRRAFRKTLSSVAQQTDDKDRYSRDLVARSESKVLLYLGERTALSCQPALSNLVRLNSSHFASHKKPSEKGVGCTWSRYQVNLINSALDGQHLSLRKEREEVEIRDDQQRAQEDEEDEDEDEDANELAGKGETSNLKQPEEAEVSQLIIKEAQLYHSGHYKCTCHYKDESELPKQHLYSEHLYKLQVSVAPQVQVRPAWQWSLPNSRVSFECNYDYIDTSFPSAPSALFRAGATRDDIKNQSTADTGGQVNNLQFGLQIGWLFQEDEGFSPPAGLHTQLGPLKGKKASFSMASSRLSLNQLELRDSGQLTCRVMPLGRPDLSASGQAYLLVQERPKPEVGQGAASGELGARLQSNQPSDVGQQRHLWMFHENGISVFKVQEYADELELVREISGHSLISSSVDGNWNKLTLCGGLNPEQVVICEWSDNALYSSVIMPDMKLGARRESNNITRKYIYVGQPNLNRMLVMEGESLEIVAIINTEPQPRKLYLYKRNKIHLSKWVKRRLSPKANAFHLMHRHHREEESAIREGSSIFKKLPNTRISRERASQAKSSPLFSSPSPPNKPLKGSMKRAARRSLSGSQAGKLEKETDEFAAASIEDGFDDEIPAEAAANKQPEEDIHLEAERREKSSSIFAPISPSESTNQGSQQLLSFRFTPQLVQHDIWLLCYGQPLVVDPGADELDPAESQRPADDDDDKAPERSRLGESELRNRKSVQIIQSTFLPTVPAQEHHLSHQDQHQHQLDEESPVSTGEHSASDPVSEFKRSTVLSSRHLRSSSQVADDQLINNHKSDDDERLEALDLIQDLHVPEKVKSLEWNERHKIHSAYITRYGESRLLRVSLNDYAYDREINLKNCDPINNLVTTAQGLLIVQCRAPISHQLTGQLVLDQLTSARIQFNPELIAQDSYLSPDHRYLISVYTNQSSTTKQSPVSERESSSWSIIYVQSVSVLGTKLEYEIKTSSLEVSECSFVWKDGYYAAILSSSNRRDNKSEIFSLRLIDSRLELVARVPGLISAASHRRRDLLTVSSQLKLAALSTNQGTFLVDLEDNRVLQTFHHVTTHHTPPTLLWV